MNWGRKCRLEDGKNTPFGNNLRIDDEEGDTEQVCA